MRDVQIQGAGFINFFLDRRAFAAALMDASLLDGGVRGAKVVIEHTNINPNKAAHIGHLRNAVLGDVLGRSLQEPRLPGRGPELHRRHRRAGRRRGGRASSTCAASRPPTWRRSPSRSTTTAGTSTARSAAGTRRTPSARRSAATTLHEMETGKGARAEMAAAGGAAGRLAATSPPCGGSTSPTTCSPARATSWGCNFFEQAFGRLKESGAVHLETEGKNAGCWVMPLSQAEEFAGLEEPDKVIVRSDGTVTYVGKDIAYQLWKFGLLGRDFGYRFWAGARGSGRPPSDGVEGHPLVRQRLAGVQRHRRPPELSAEDRPRRAPGPRPPAEAERSIHFAYEMVALSPATARQLGFLGRMTRARTRSSRCPAARGSASRPTTSSSQLEVKAREEIAKRNRDAAEAELDGLAHEIAIAALRFFMVKATNNRIIAFDFDEALSFEGESGPYLQYSLVRAKNIRRRLQQEGIPADVFAEEVAALPHELWAEDLWGLILEVAQTGETVEKAAESLELSLIARHALEIAQHFNALYHRNPILQEKDPQVRAARLATVQIFRRGLESLGELLGIPVPEKM